MNEPSTPPVVHLANFAAGLAWPAVAACAVAHWLADRRTLIPNQEETP